MGMQNSKVSTADEINGRDSLVATLLDPQGRSVHLLQCHRFSLCGHWYSPPPPYSNSKGGRCLSEVGREGTELFVQHGPPDHIRSDNGSEFTAHAVRDWLGRIGVKTLYIEPGSPWENGYNESFNSKLRDEILNTEIFYTLKEAKVLIERWRHHYNTIRPHSSLGYRPPAPETILPNVDGPTYAVDGLRLAHQLNPQQTLT